MEGADDRRRAAAQVLVGDLAAPGLDEDDLHHLARVLRLRAGEPVCAADGAGGWRMCRFTGGADLEPDGETRHEAAPEPVEVGFVPVKGDRPELVVQKLTELGVDVIHVVGSVRAVVRWEGDRASKHLERLRRVAREASQQCRRLWLPAIEVGDLSALAARGKLAEPGGRPPGPADRLVLVGPEGGWAPEELAAASGTVSLGPNVLRAETAAIAAGVMLTALRAGLLTGHLPHSP